MPMDPHDAVRLLGRKLDLLQASLDHLRREFEQLRDSVAVEDTPPEAPAESLSRLGAAATPPAGIATHEPPMPPPANGLAGLGAGTEGPAPASPAPCEPATGERPLERMIDILSRDEGTRQQGEAQAAVSITRPAAASTPPMVPPPVPKAAPASEPQPRRPDVRPAAAPTVRMSWESAIGANWLNRVGVLILLLAGAFLVHLAWQRQWVGPHAQVAMIFVTGALLLAGGEYYQRRRLPVFAQGLTSLGIFALYAAGFVGYRMHHLVSLNISFIVYVAITTGSFLIATRTRSIAVVLLGMLGGYLTPVILSTGQDAPVALFTYLLFLNAAISATAIARRWDFLGPIAFAATALMFGGWYMEFYEPHKIWTLETMLALHAGLFMAAALFPHAALGWPSSRISLWMLSQSSLVFFGLTYLLFRDRPDHRLGEFAAAYGVGHWIIAGGVYAIRRAGDRLPAYLLGLGAIFITLAVPIYFGTNSRAIAWSVQALVFTLIGIRFRSEKTLWSAAVVYGLAVWWTCREDIATDLWRGEWLRLDLRFVTTAIVSIMLAGGGLAYWLGRERIGALATINAPQLAFAFAVVADVLLAAAALHQFPEHRLAMAWAVNALAVTAIARWRRSDPAMTFGLLLLAPAGMRFLQFQWLTAAPAEWLRQIDVRFAAGLLVVACAWLAAYLARRGGRWCDLPDRSTLAVVGGDVVLLFASTLQWEGTILTKLWPANALALGVFARLYDLRRMGWVAASAFGLTTIRWLLGDGAAQNLSGEDDEWPSNAVFVSGLTLVAAGWLGAALFRRREPRLLGSTLGLGMVFVLLVAIAYRWDGFAVLALWTAVVAMLWTAGFVMPHTGARAQALVLWIAALGGWIFAHGLPWRSPLDEFQVIANARFASLALVAAVGIAATVAYCRIGDRLRIGNAPGLLETAGAGSEASTGGPFREFLGTWVRDELRCVHIVCVVLANLLLAGAMTLDVNTLFDRYVIRGDTPFPDLFMARQATLSILWASHAATLFVAGFAVRYAPIRIMAMAALALILVKVFLVDLRNLELIYRVLSFAVLGMVFVGVSFLYQRYRSRLGEKEEGGVV